MRNKPSRIYLLIDHKGEPYFLDDAGEHNFAMGPDGELRLSGQFEIL